MIVASSFTKRFPWCISAWKKPSLIAKMRKVFIIFSPTQLNSIFFFLIFSRSFDGLASTHSVVSIFFDVKSQNILGISINSSYWVFSIISDCAAASSLRSISIDKLSSRVLTTSMILSLLASDENFSKIFAAK